MQLLKKIKAFVLTKHFLKHTGLIILTYVLVVGLVALYLNLSTNHNEKIEVPKVVGLKAEKANELLTALDLKMELLDSVYRPDLPVGTIVSQDPEATKLSQVFVKSGRIIRVQVSKKNRLVEMPGLVDRSERFAQSVLKNRGLKYRITYVPTSESDGAVLKQLYKGKEIKEGTRISVGETITLVVGENNSAEPVELIDLNGITISDAKARLSNVTILFSACDGCLTSADSSSATIYSQSPEYIEGATVQSGSTVFVSARKE
jgi:hypothetical protein